MILVVLAGMLVGNWRDVVALIGSFSLLAGFLFATIAFALGTVGVLRVEEQLSRNQRMRRSWRGVFRVSQGELNS